jgi:hypothetical protein
MTIKKHDWQSEFKRLEGAYAPATLKSYLVDVRIFVDWCDARQICALPAQVETVCAFLEDQAAGLCPSTVRRRLYAIRKVHRLLHLANPTWDEEINIAIRRVRRSPSGTLAVIVATATAVLGPLYHAERRLPILEPDAVLVVLVVVGGLALVSLLS